MPLLRLCRPSVHYLTHARLSRSFTAFSPAYEKPLPPRRSISENEITESFLKGTGPGGQKINKTSSAVQLKHLPTGIVIKHQGTRSRDQNRKVARRLLSERLEELEKGDQSRTALKAERKRVKKASGDKKKKRKYKKLDEEKATTVKGRENRGSSSDAVAAGLFMAGEDALPKGTSGIDDADVALDEEESEEKALKGAIFAPHEPYEDENAFVEDEDDGDNEDDDDDDNDEDYNVEDHSNDS